MLQDVHTYSRASRRLFKLAALAALAASKLCAIYDIRTNDLPTSWHVSRGLWSPRLLVGLVD